MGFTNDTTVDNYQYAKVLKGTWGESTPTATDSTLTNVKENGICETLKKNSNELSEARNMAADLCRILKGPQCEKDIGELPDFCPESIIEELRLQSVIIGGTTNILKLALDILNI